MAPRGGGCAWGGAWTASRGTSTLVAVAVALARLAVASVFAGVALCSLLRACLPWRRLWWFGGLGEVAWQFLGRGLGSVCGSVSARGLSLSWFSPAVMGQGLQCLGGWSSWAAGAGGAGSCRLVAGVGWGRGMGGCRDRLRRGVVGRQCPEVVAVSQRSGLSLWPRRCARGLHGRGCAWCPVTTYLSPRPGLRPVGPRLW